MTISRRKAIGITASAAAVLSAPAVVQAQGAFPSRPISLICPWPAGGSTDLMLRSLAEAATKIFGQAVVIDNKAGATGTLGPATMAATAKPDGYTLSQMPIVTARLPLMQKTSFDTIKDFTYILHLTGYTFGVTTKADGPFKKWQDVIDFAKANPGKVSYASPGTGSSLHIGMEQIAAHSGVQFTHVPFKGGSETGAAVLGGHTMLQADSTGWRPLVEAGQLRLLNLWTAERSPTYKDAPTLKELGYPFVFDSPFGLAGPKGMDPSIVKILHDGFKTALEEKSVQETMLKYDMPPRYMNTADYTKFVGELINQERAALSKIGLLKKD
ncbi:MAG: Bug family tripartite tricarboxylate transporter substrate binding protein [Hyphomicrobiaceae bacterium]